MPSAKRTLLLLALGALAVLLFAVTQPVSGSDAKTKARGGDAATRPVKDQDPAKYVGADNCKVCHEDLFKNLEKTPHWKTTLDKRGPQWQGCESCHGPGAEHASSGDATKIFSYKGKSVKQVSDNCLQCHLYGAETSNFARSAHKIANVSCLDCHSVHSAKVRQFQLVKSQPDLCYSCHNEVKPEFSRPFRHRVNEGLLKCSECHNQHGGFLTKGLRSTAAQDQVCFTCHVEKAGPFVFEHAPVKTEGCMACHLPHGSSNPRMLRRNQVNLLCLECHTFTADTPVPGIPTFHNQAVKYQACTICHVTVHGSNHSAVFFK